MLAVSKRSIETPTKENLKHLKEMITKIVSEQA
jgi:hypothetical protein